MRSSTLNALAERDCRTCNRRRILCDRKLPFCSKCSNKGLVCPGYTQTLRWTNAIAVRGRFRGLATPDGTSAAASHTQVGDSDDSPPPATNAYSPSGAVTVLERFTQSMAARLLEYYEIHITPMMTWIDSPYNGYRRFILPLAATQPILRLSIFVSAAGHAGYDIGVDEDLLKSASETVIMMITQRLSQLNEQDPDTDVRYDIDSTEILAIIAAILVLSDYSLLQSHLYVAQSHREGIRTLLSTLEYTAGHESEVLAFMRDEIAAYDVLACTSLFQLDRIRNAILPSARSGIFGDFLRLVHAISVFSVRLDDDDGNQNTADIDDLKDMPSSLMELENDFEAARGATLLAAGSLLQSEPDLRKRDFVFLVAAYHHAGLLYAHQRLSHIEMDQTACSYHRGRLFEALERIQEIQYVLGGLTWPLFIAGICSGDSAEHMRKVEGWCELLVTYTRYEHYNLLRKYLSELNYGPQRDWILLAKQYESNGHPVVPI